MLKLTKVVVEVVQQIKYLLHKPDVLSSDPPAFLQYNWQQKQENWLQVPGPARLEYIRYWQEITRLCLSKTNSLKKEKKKKPQNYDICGMPILTHTSYTQIDNETHPRSWVIIPVITRQEGHRFEGTANPVLKKRKKKANNSQ